jgi:hypothetical protein
MDDMLKPVDRAKDDCLNPAHKPDELLVTKELAIAKIVAITAYGCGYFNPMEILSPICILAYFPGYNRRRLSSPRRVGLGALGYA